MKLFPTEVLTVHLIESIVQTRMPKASNAQLEIKEADFLGKESLYCSSPL